MTANSDDELALVRRLCSGDATAFEALVSSHHPSMVRLARTFVATDAAAEDVVQETWLAALRGIERFEGRSSVKTWLFRILVNRAKTQGIRDARSLPFSCLGQQPSDQPETERPFSEDSCAPASHPQPSGLSQRQRNPERALLDGETRIRVGRALKRLPANQRRVVLLRDVAGFSAAEVCAMIDLTETNQRVLLHRGRTAMRAFLDDLQPAT